MASPWYPPRSIYTDPSRYAPFPIRRSGYSMRPLRPYNRHSAATASTHVRLPPHVPDNAVLPGPTGGTAPLPGRAISLPLYVDSSMLSLWRSCKRRHFWSTLNALYPTGQSVHLIAGGAIAAGCEAARRWVFSQRNPEDTSHQSVLEAAYPAFSEAWGSYEPPPDNPRNAKTYVNTWSALANYLEVYPPGRDAVQPLRRADGSPATEYRFAIPLPITHPSGDPILFVGRFDMVGRYNLGGSEFTVVLDEKTTGAFTMGWADSWDLRGQFMGYVWALRAQGIDCSHAVVRGIAIQKTQYDTRSALVMYPNHMIDRWERQMLSDVHEIVDRFTLYQKGGLGADEAYPYDFADACSSYGGCAYRHLCFAAHAEDFMTNYTHYVWNPLEPTPIQETS